MSRILLADDSPHAQRMGERLLRDEGHEVVTITDGETVMVRLPDVDPDILILDANLPGRNGYDIAKFVKSSSYHRHAGVLLSGSLAEPVDAARAAEAGADGSVSKPFEAATLNAIVKQAAVKSAELREMRPAGPPPPEPGAEPKFVSGAVASAAEPETPSQPEPRLAPLGVKASPEIDPSPLGEETRVRAAIILALEASMPALVDELTRRVLKALHSK